MRRPLINTNVNQKTNLSINTQTTNRTFVELSGVALDKRLRQKRSTNYINNLTKLDAGGVTSRQTQIEELKEIIQNEFPDLSPYQFPIGIIAKCYLGNPFEVHTLDIKLDIIQHYKRGESIPNLDRGRNLALHPSYAFIEVYSDTLRAVTKNGDVAVIKG